MKNFLAIDTSNNHLAVLAAKNGNVQSVFIPDCAMKHAVSIMPAVEEALKKADLRLEECDFFAAVVGAGSFTGIRIGISAVKGFCLAFGKPALPVTSFDVAAYNGLDVQKQLCLVDALHDCYYACGYEGDKVVFQPAYLEEEEILGLIKEGYTLVSCTKLPLAEKATVFSADPCKGLERAVLALSAEKKFGELTALYVRKSSAELNQGK
ncbi:MAG: tRNA (adenosine(37)-N6)-threonylcarbamoyltransferase complex dimerization subunit type 1 TsaB [Clostridia bacterium]|nr:tRNA (adenosine(37)-N6)-threonylcarbamoyltransferase complex dimerization subunit type 1 TsaB [Clostridia bacterium]